MLRRYAYGKLSPTCDCCNWYMNATATERAAYSGECDRYLVNMGKVCSCEVPRQLSSHALCSHSPVAVVVGQLGYKDPASCTYFITCFNSFGGTVGTDRWVYILIQGSAEGAGGVQRTARGSLTNYNSQASFWAYSWTWFKMPSSAASLSGSLYVGRGLHAVVYLLALTWWCRVSPAHGAVAVHVTVRDPPDSQALRVPMGQHVHVLHVCGLCW